MTDPRTEAGCGGPGFVDDTETRRSEGTAQASPSVPEQPRSGTSAALLADPGADGRYRREWLDQKIVDWQEHPPLYFTNPRPAPTGGPRWTPPALVCDSAQLQPVLVDVVELVACGSGR